MHPSMYSYIYIITFKPKFNTNIYKCSSYIQSCIHISFLANTHSFNLFLKIGTALGNTLELCPQLNKVFKDLSCKLNNFVVFFVQCEIAQERLMKFSNS